MSRASAALGLLGVVLLQACSSTTPLGQRLAESFDPPAASTPATPRDQSPPAQVDAPRSAGTPDSTPASPPVKPVPMADDQQRDDTRRQQSAARPVPKPSIARQPLQPYRITIRLAGADPSAPAELVTRTLREAGIGFEVETIERIAPGAVLQVRPQAPGADP